MRSYSDILKEMQRSIMEADSSHAATFHPAKPGFSPEAQISVYIEGYRLRLQQVLSRNFPATKALLQQEWNALASGFIESTPSELYNLDRYPLRFSEYLASRHAGSFAAELARLERAILETYLAGDSDALDPAWLASQPPEALETLRLYPRTALLAERFSYPVHSYLADFRSSGALPETPPQATEQLIICRHNNTVRRHEAAPDEFAMFTTLADGDSLGDALQQMESRHGYPAGIVVPKLQQWFSRWLSEGWLRQP